MGFILAILRGRILFERRCGGRKTEVNCRKRKVIGCKTNQKLNRRQEVFYGYK